MILWDNPLCEYIVLDPNVSEVILVTGKLTVKMKRRIELQNDLKHLPPVHYLHAANKTYKPYSDNKGIHCAGDRFGYIVDWEIAEKKEKKPNLQALR